MADVQTSAAVQLTRVLERIREAGDEGTVFLDPSMQSAAWACCERGFVAQRLAEYPPADEVTQAGTVPVRGRWRYVGLTPRGVTFLSNPTREPVNAETDSPERAAAREETIAR